MKRIAVAATILTLNLATMSAAAQDKPVGSRGAAGLGRVTEPEPEEGLVIDAQEPIEILLNDDPGQVDLRLDPELMRALADLERSRELLDDPIFDPSYTRTHYTYNSSYSSGSDGRLALKLIPLGIGLVVLIVRASRKD